MPEVQRPKMDSVALAAMVVPGLAVLVQVGFLYFVNKTELGLGFPIDDAYIFQRYAENLAAGHGFSFNPGETSFGCTSLLWPLFMAVWSKLLWFLDYVTIGFLLGGNLHALSCILLAYIVYRNTGNAMPTFAAGALASLSPTLLMNAISGMENPLRTALLMVFAAIVLDDRPRPVEAGFFAGLLAITRPEGLYFALAVIVAWLMLAALGRKVENPGMLAKFLLPLALAAAPFYVLVHSATGSFLPTTFMGKIVSINPATLDFGLGRRLFLGGLSLFDGWMKLGVTLRFLSVPVLFGALFEAGATIYRAWRGKSGQWPLAGRLIMSGYLLMPFAYGLSFPVGPAFGGYYVRYIAPALMAAILMAGLGFKSMGEAALSKWPALRRYPESINAAQVTCLCLLCFYSVWLWRFQFEDAEKVLRREVSINTGVRMEAARWISEHADPEARVLVGYTGLGVIGQNCDRYVLDLGALINPDIFDYYLEAGMAPEKRWLAAVNYMKDRDLTYYVTFPPAGQYKKVIVDPDDTPGFREVARVGSRRMEPEGPFEQVRVYKVDWRVYDAATERKAKEEKERRKRERLEIERMKKEREEAEAKEREETGTEEGGTTDEGEEAVEEGR